MCRKRSSAASRSTADAVVNVIPGPQLDTDQQLTLTERTVRATLNRDLV
jgi:hypothetical protein